jgi:hypothetical protein
MKDARCLPQSSNESFTSLEGMATPFFEDLTQPMETVEEGEQESVQVPLTSNTSKALFALYASKQCTMDYSWSAPRD